MGCAKKIARLKKRRKKEHDFSDHLGNVTVQVSDKKAGNRNDLRANIRSYQQYYPFGWSMPGRSNSIDRSRYGFNGKELDNEWGIQDYGFRMYDTRLARFLSVDPLKYDYPWNSTYAFAENTPITYIDLDGLEKFKITDKPSTGGTILRVVEYKPNNIEKEENIIYENVKGYEDGQYANFPKETQKKDSKYAQKLESDYNPKEGSNTIAIGYYLPAPKKVKKASELTEIKTTGDLETVLKEEGLKTITIEVDVNTFATSHTPKAMRDFVFKNRKNEVEKIVGKGNLKDVKIELKKGETTSKPDGSNGVRYYLNERQVREGKETSKEFLTRVKNIITEKKKEETK